MIMAVGWADKGFDITMANMSRKGGGEGNEKTSEKMGNYPENYNL